MSVKASLAVLAALAVVAFAAPAESRSIRAVIVGIDDYMDREGVLPDLTGAVNDARDIEGTLRGLGVEDLTVLLDAEARRTNVLSAWRGALARAEPGDALLLTYAGHGMQTEKRADSDEDDQRDELLALHGFDRYREGRGDFILDDEIARFVDKAKRKNVEVMLVVDACHSGTSFRSLDSRAKPRYRFSSVKVEGDLLAGLPDDDLFADLNAEEIAPEAAAPDNLYAFSAVLDDQLAPEIPLPGPDGTAVPRGAMSYFFARGLRGAADTDNDGAVRFGEMKRYVLRNISTATEGAQIADVNARVDADSAVLFAHARPQPVAPPPEWPIRLAVHGDAPPPTLFGVAIVTPEASPDLIWDPAKLDVISGIDAVVARNVAPAMLQGVVDKWRARQRLIFMGERSAVEVSTRPAKATFRDGESVTLTVTADAPYLLLANIANDGTVQMLYPLDAEEAAPRTPGDPLELPNVTVEGPFGADLLVAVASNEPLKALADAAATLDGKVRPMALIDAIERNTPQTREVGLLSFYTCDGEPGSC